MRQALGRGATAEWGTRRKAITEVTCGILKPRIDACLGYQSNYAHGFGLARSPHEWRYVVYLHRDIEAKKITRVFCRFFPFLPGVRRARIVSEFKSFTLGASCAASPCKMDL
jgi:hypothetical protein